MQYKVPQNIDLEDKIVGPFTMKQFLYLLVGGFILYGWWKYANEFVSPPPMLIFLPIGLPVGILCLCLAMVKINDRPFEYFLLNIARFIASPKSRKWVTGYTPESVIKLDAIEAEKKKEVSKTTSDLDSLAKSLEKQTTEIAQKNPAMLKKPTGKPEKVNLSVKDLQTASQNQQQSQATGAKSKGFLGIFK